MRMIYMRTWAIVFILALMCSCATVREVPINTVQKDSTRVERVIEYRDTTIYVDVPREIIREAVLELDTLIMENSVAVSRSFFDTNTKTLKGELRNKNVSLPHDTKLPEFIEKEFVFEEAEKEVPVKVEIEKPFIPKIFWWSLGANAVFVILTVFRIYRRFRP